MTIKELYEWAKVHNALDLDIEIEIGNGSIVECNPIIAPRHKRCHTEKVVSL
jgi:hypothetical protein